MSQFWSVDTGGITGYAIFNWNGPEDGWASTRCIVAKGEDYWTVIGRLSYMLKSGTRPDAIICEEIRLWMDKRQDRNIVSTIEKVGGVELLAWQYDIPFERQPNTINAKGALRTKVRDVLGIKLVSDGFGKDAQSAELHGFYFAGVRV